LADWYIHAANVLYLVSYLTRDMMWLRLLTCAGLALGIAFFTCQPIPLYGPCVWQVVFFGINLVQIRRLIQERRRVKLSEERERVAQEAFKDLSRDEMLNLLTRAMCAQSEKLPDLQQAAREPLSEDEEIVRDIAFRGLSKKELLNLLTRRLWYTLRWVNPARWRLRPKTFAALAQSAATTPLKGEVENRSPASAHAQRLSGSPLPLQGRGVGGEGSTPEPVGGLPV
jgi:Popeye protein conserved region